MTISRTGYRQYAILTEDPSFLEFGRFADQYQLHCDLHLNRTRVLIPRDTSIETQFLLKFPSAFIVNDYAAYG